MPKRAGVAYPKKSVFSTPTLAIPRDVGTTPTQEPLYLEPEVVRNAIVEPPVGSAILPRIDDFIGIAMGLKFQVYDYEPVDVNVYYGSAIKVGETPESAGERIAQVVSAELDKRTKSLVADLNRLRAEAFDALAGEEG